MSEAPKTVWVTRYALTDGVLEGMTTEINDGIAYIRCPSLGVADYFAGLNWHPTREAAVARANEMKAAKIASLKRQIERLESLEF